METSKKASRLTKYEEWERDGVLEEKLALIKGWRMNGVTQQKIAENVGINEDTLCKYKNRYPRLKEALDKGKEQADLEVEDALFKRAVGYTIRIEEEKLDKDGVTHLLKKDVHIPGDVGAQIFWLKNRRYTDWRDKINFEDETKQNDGIIKELIGAIKDVKNSK